MSATQELIAAALTAAEVFELSARFEDEKNAVEELREACARVMVQPAAPDTAERDALIADNERLSGLYKQAVKGRADMRILAENMDALIEASNPVSEVEDAAMHAALRTSVTLVAKGLPVSAAEVQFPIPDKTLYGADRTVSGHFYTAAKVRTYGDAREAAGYARGLAAGPPKDCGDAGHDEGRCGNASCGRSAQAGLVSKVIEQRLRTWHQSRMNKSGDRLSLDDFMGPDSIDDLVDCVCDEFAIDAALRGEVK